MKRIRITDQKIEDGQPGEIDLCPVALALKEAFKTDNVSVDQNTLSVTVSYEFETPAKVRQFIKKFDDNQQVQPFEFTLRGHGI